METECHFCATSHTSEHVKVLEEQWREKQKRSVSRQVHPALF